MYPCVAITPAYFIYDLRRILSQSQSCIWVFVQFMLLLLSTHTIVFAGS